MLSIKLSIVLIIIGTGDLANGVPLDNKNAVFFTSRIVGGVDAPDGFARHMIALVFGDRMRSLMCGASIVSDNHVLTAAHCIDALTDSWGELITTLRGGYGSNRWDTTENLVKFSHYKNHEGWNSFMIKNDIGVLFLEDELSRSDKVGVIPLNYDWVGGGDHSYVTGWGRLSASGAIPSKLQLLYIETLDEQTCLTMYQGLWAPPVDQRIELCTLHPKGHGYGMCNGDSGSALVSTKSGTQTGIVSWGIPCAFGAPDVFVRVSAYKDWLQNILEQ